MGLLGWTCGPARLIKVGLCQEEENRGNKDTEKKRVVDVLGHEI